MRDPVVPEKYAPFPYYQEAEPARLETGLDAIKVIFFLLLHIPLALLSYWSPLFSTLYALGTLALGFLWLASDKTPERLIYLTAYLTGAELIWRGTNASIFYEFGKYSVAFLLVLATLKYQRFAKANKAILVYFLLLLPSILVMPGFNRFDISFHLSGPLALAVCTMFFSTADLTRENIKRSLLALLAPVVGLGFLTLFVTLSVETIQFTSWGTPSRVTSAGIGPNQVSNILSLGALASFFYILLERRYQLIRLLMLGLTLWLLAQAMLTFSRGGFYTTLGAVFLSSLFFLRERRTQAALLLAGLVIFFAGYFVVLPILEDFSGGTLSARFTDPNTSGRIEIFQADMIAFRAHPLFGVGPGQSDIYHSMFFGGELHTAHTEYSRLLAEHGIFGVLALLILLGLSLERFLRKEPTEQKGFRVLTTGWVLLFMTHSAMRLVAAPFLFGLGGVGLQLDEDEAPNDDKPDQPGWFNNET